MHPSLRAALLAASVFACATSAGASTIIRQIDFDLPSATGVAGTSFFGSITVEMTAGITTPGTLPALGPTADFHLLQAEVNVTTSAGGAAIALASSPSDVSELTFRAVDGRLVYVMLKHDPTGPGDLGQGGDWTLIFSSQTNDPSQDVLTGVFPKGYVQTYSFCYGATATYFYGFANGGEFCVFEPQDFGVSTPSPSVGQVPVPAALPLLGMGLLGIAALRRRG